MQAYEYNPGTAVFHTALKSVGTVVASEHDHAWFKYAEGGVTKHEVVLFADLETVTEKVAPAFAESDVQPTEQLASADVDEAPAKKSKKSKISDDEVTK